MASNKSAYDKPLNQRNKSNGKSANANQALSGVTRFVHAEEAPTTHAPTLNVRTLTFKRECRVIIIESSSIRYKFSAYKVTQFTTEINKKTSNELCRLRGFGDGYLIFPNTNIEARELGQVRVFFSTKFF